MYNSSMSDADGAAILVVRDPIDAERLRELAEKHYGDIVKAVMDVRLRKIALGGDLHADEESALTNEPYHRGLAEGGWFSFQSSSSSLTLGARSSARYRGEKADNKRTFSEPSTECLNWLISQSMIHVGDGLGA